MKIQLLSDLHLEAHPDFRPCPAPGAEVLVLAGDIGSYQSGSLLTERGDADFGLARFSPWNGWPVPVIFVPGNHEYDALDFDEAHARLQETCERLGLIWLEREQVTLTGADGVPVRFIGTTLWSDFDALGPTSGPTGTGSSSGPDGTSRKPRPVGTGGGIAQSIQADSLQTLLLRAREKAFRAANFYLRKTGGTRAGALFLAEAIREQAEAGNFDALVVGRRGLGAMGSMFFGSTSGELIERCHTTPLWIVDGTVTSTRFLLAVQNHPASLMAADHLGFILKNHPNVEICLYHSDSVFGSQQSSRPEDFHTNWGKAWCDQYLDIDNFLFYAHAQLLIDNGIPRHRITQLPVQMHLDVSSDLLRQAKKHSCGTIVIGRRRRDTAKGQFKGISDKTAKQAENIAIWFAG